MTLIHTYSYQDGICGCVVVHGDHTMKILNDQEMFLGSWNIVSTRLKNKNRKKKNGQELPWLEEYSSAFFQEKNRSEWKKSSLDFIWIFFSGFASFISAWFYCILLYYNYACRSSHHYYFSMHFHSSKRQINSYDHFTLPSCSSLPPHAFFLGSLLGKRVVAKVYLIFTFVHTYLQSTALLEVEGGKLSKVVYIFSSRDSKKSKRILRIEPKYSYNIL